VLISELLDNHQGALKEKEGEIAELRRQVEGLSAAGEAATRRLAGSRQIWTVKCRLTGVRKKSWSSLKDSHGRRRPCWLSYLTFKGASEERLEIVDEVF